MSYDKDWARVDVDTVPNIKVKPPGPQSLALAKRAGKYMAGYSSQAQLFPVAFESGNGVILRDVDGNEYIDFSSGIYITNWGHCHPKITESVVEYTRKLQNCHDFNTEIKARLAEALVQITPGDLNNVQLWCEGSKCVEAALNVARMVTGKHEFISFYNDMHGKTLGAQSLTAMTKASGPRAAGSFRVPFGNCYRCSFKLKYPECGLHCVDFLREAITELTTNDVAAIVVEPIQGWGGSVIPPDEWLPKIRELCDELGILLIVDEVLTCMGRTGKMFCVEHWNVVPDIMTLGKGFGNGFPVTAVVYSDKFNGMLDGIKASSSYGGNPMACAAALACVEVAQEEGMLEHAMELGNFILKKLEAIKVRHPLVGDVRGKGCLLGMELVKDRDTREPFEQAANMVYQKAFERGVSWIPAKQNLRMSPPLIMTKDVAGKAVDLIEEAIAETEQELGIQ
ncbi:MAG: aspartate aminotransferase family protein [Lentisphaerae bacterium]|nr:aspartate aminotransferase family protein [Lentisphaerota bacterium]